MSSGPGPPSTGPYQQNVPERRSESSRALEGLGAGTVIDNINAFPAGQVEDVLCELSLGIDDNVIGASLLCDRDLVLRRDASDHASAPQLYDLGQQKADPAGRRMNEGDVTRLHRIEIGGEVTGGQTLHHDGCGRTIVDRVGNSNK